MKKSFVYYGLLFILINSNLFSQNTIVYQKNGQKISDEIAGKPNDSTIQIVLNNNNETGKYGMGVELCPSSNYLYGNSEKENLKSLFSINTGFVFIYNFSSIFSLQTGLSFERKGAEYILNNVFWNVKYKYYLDYATIPIIFKTKLGNNFFLNAGTFISYCLNQVYYMDVPEKSNYPQLHQSGEVFVDPASLVNTIKFDYGFIVGLGVKIPVSSDFSIIIDLNDYLSLLNTRKYPILTDRMTVPLNIDNSSYLNAIVMHLGFIYNF